MKRMFINGVKKWTFKLKRVNNLPPEVRIENEGNYVWLKNTTNNREDK